ncbi:hypothetical protein LJC42_04610 [Eubacteriales bacterium OttesenSCG-928-K08]|nr:hypothetical protein [Eubacteriales bacterium OttesenSCG-928-K08]
MKFSSIKMKKILLLCICALIVAASFPSVAYANSAEPPGLTIIVTSPPADLELALRFEDDKVVEPVVLQKNTKAWEAYYRFFYGAHPTSLRDSDWVSLQSVTLIATSQQKSFECVIPTSELGRYNNYITLNYGNESISVGQNPMRQVLLISMRVILTLVIEGLVFFLFKYREKSSWVKFFVVNLITQGALNVLLAGSGTYWMIGFIILEVLIFIIEMIAFAFILKEHKKGRAVLYALCANAASLVVGGLLLAYLPV